MHQVSADSGGLPRHDRDAGSVGKEVEYTLRRQSLLRAVRAGLKSTDEACDASPYLISASRFHGEQSTSRCPICRRQFLWLVHYIFGDELRGAAGQARNRAELTMLAQQYRRFDVYLVEVCRGCGWNHLVRSFELGQDAHPPTAAASVTPLASSGAPRLIRTDFTKR